jgi:N-acetylmuramoyl-L-alanine amidase
VVKNPTTNKDVTEDELGDLVAKVIEADPVSDASLPALDKKVTIDQPKDQPKDQILETKTSKVILADGSTKYVIKKYSTKEVDETKKDGKNSLAVIKKKQKPIIVIDPGHGGKDPGTIGNYARSKEKNITLAYARELKIALDKTKKYKVYLTRNSDIFIPLSRRVEMARKVKADLFISLHANSAANRKASGLSIYTLSETSSDKQAELLAQKENRADIIAGADFSNASPDIMKTLIDLSQRDSMNSSAIYANLAIKSMQNFDIEILNNTHRFAGFRVLTAPDMVSVLIELGYLSNKSEEKKLNDVKYR